MFQSQEESFGTYAVQSRRLTAVVLAASDERVNKHGPYVRLLSILVRIVIIYVRTNLTWLVPTA